MTIRGIVLYTGDEELHLPLFVAEKVLREHTKETPYWPRVWIDMEKAAREYVKEQKTAELRRG